MEPFQAIHYNGSAQDGWIMNEVVANSNAPDNRASKAGFHPASLDAINFLLSDVRGALGPYLNVFLVTQQHWSQSEVGLVTTVSGLLGLSVQTPIGAAIDETRAKRGLVILALVVLAIGATAIFAMPSFWPVAIANSLIAIAGDVFGPAVAALTLGLYTRKQLARRMGRNSAFDHAGNVAIAVTAGAVGSMIATCCPDQKGASRWCERSTVRTCASMS